MPGIGYHEEDAALAPNANFHLQGEVPPLRRIRIRQSLVSRQQPNVRSHYR